MYYSCSRQNSFKLSRQNSINSQNTLSPQNSLGWGTPKEPFKQNNLVAALETRGSQEQDEDTELEDERVSLQRLGIFLNWENMRTALIYSPSYSYPGVVIIIVSDWFVSTYIHLFPPILIHVLLTVTYVFTMYSLLVVCQIVWMRTDCMNEKVNKRNTKYWLFQVCPCLRCPEPTGVFRERKQWALYIFSPENRSVNNKILS